MAEYEEVRQERGRRISPSFETTVSKCPTLRVDASNLTHPPHLRINFKFLHHKMYFEV